MVARRPLKRLWMSVALATTVLAVFASGAAAFTLPPGLLGGPGPELALRAPGGYRLQVNRDDRHHVSLSVSKGAASNSYVAPGTAAGGEIEADFGRFGRVAVSFEPHGKPQPTPPFPGCSGKPMITRPGVFRGKIRFRGEGGFTSVDADGAHGTITTSPPWHCTGKKPESPPKGGGGEAGEEDPDLGAFLFARCGEALFFAGGGRSSSKPAPVFPDDRAFTLFGASAEERVGPVTIERGIFAAGSGGAFSFDDALTTATVRPPPPFHGKAVYSLDAAGKPRWTGGLTASFIGRDVAMAGPDFGVRLFGADSDLKGTPAVPGGSCAATT